MPDAKSLGCPLVLLKPDPTRGSHLMFSCYICERRLTEVLVMFYLNDYIPQRTKHVLILAFGIIPSEHSNIRFQTWKNSCLLHKATSKKNGIEMCDFTYLLSYVVTCE